MIGMFEFVDYILMGLSSWVLSHSPSRGLKCDAWCEWEPKYLILCMAQVWCDLVYYIVSGSASCCIYPRGASCFFGWRPQDLWTNLHHMSRHGTRVNLCVTLP